MDLQSGPPKRTGGSGSTPQLLDLHSVPLEQNGRSQDRPLGFRIFIPFRWNRMERVYIFDSINEMSSSRVSNQSIRSRQSSWSVIDFFQKP